MKCLLALLLFVSTAQAEFFTPGTFITHLDKGTYIQLKISKAGKIRSDFPLQLPQGFWVSADFPEPLTWDSELGIFASNGYFPLRMIGPGIDTYCFYPVRLEANFLPKEGEIDVSLSFSQRYWMQGGCLSEGEGQTFYLFERQKK